MASKYRFLHIIFILLLSIVAFNAIAQPTLPDIAGAADKGLVILSWNCQYDGVKKITVLRSSDSSYNFSEIGKVKKLEKGVQAFVDGHPNAGRNYYRIIVVFSSGLTWSSNRCYVEVERSEMEKSNAHLPPNDSIQRYIVTTDTAKRKGAVTAPPLTKQPVKDNLSVEPEEDSEQATTKTKRTAGEKEDNEETDTAGIVKPAEPKRRIYLSFDMDTITYTIASSKPQSSNKPVQHKVISVSFDDPTTTMPTFIRSLYVFTDPVSGHVNLNLPNDVASHHYSIKFYNQENQVILEVPKLNASKIIIDKRNFQHSGVYKFVLRKDVTELEQGYITLQSLNP